MRIGCRRVAEGEGALPISRLLVSAIVFFAFFGSVARAEDDPAAKICLAVLTVDIKDTNSSQSEEEHFNQYKSILKTAQFKSYQELQSSGQSIGINIPIAAGLIGLSEDAKSDSGKFQKEMADFLNSTYSEKRDKIRTSSRSSTINSQLLSVAENCHNQYFESLRDRIRFLVEVEPNGYATYNITITANVPAGVEHQFIIRQIEPSGVVTCTENGEPVSFGTNRESHVVLLKCVKPETTSIVFRVLTSVGVAPPVTLGARPTGTEEEVAPKVVVGKWGPSHPAIGSPLTAPCPCVSFKKDEDTSELINNCNSPVTALYVKDSDPAGGSTPAELPRSGREFSYVILENDRTVDFDLTGAKASVMFLYSCPGISVPAAPMHCYIDPSVLPPGVPPRWCDGSVPATGKAGDACTCPKYENDASGNIIITGTNPGKFRQ
jgi:hypothetical protein